MKTLETVTSPGPSLEALVECDLLHMESLHPGGLEMARELAELCGIEAGTKVLDVAAGTGETACYLVEQFGAQVVAIDASAAMIRRAGEKARAQGFDIEFQQADAAQLPFGGEVFDVALCECTLCLLDKRRVVKEMMRVLRPAGRVGMHDLCWQENASEKLKRTLAEIEGERPETLDGWRRLFEDGGLVELRAVDKSDAKANWMRRSRRQIGLRGQVALVRNVISRWGISGLWTVLRSQRAFSSPQLGYGIVVGTKP